MFSKFLSVISSLAVVLLAKFYEIPKFIFLFQREVMMNSLCACQCRESFQNGIVPSLGPSRIAFVTQWRLDTALSECSTPRYSTVHRDDFEGKSSQIPKFDDCSIDSGVPALKSLQNGVVEQWRTTKLPSCLFWGQKVWNIQFQENLSDFAGKQSDLCGRLSELWRNLVAARDTRTIKYLYCDAKIVFDRAGEVSGRFQPPSQSQTLSRKKYRGFSRWTTISVAMTNQKLDNHKIV